MIFKIIVSDREFNIIDEVQDIVNDISWTYNRIGGCDSFSYTIPSRFCRNILMAPGFNVKIYRRNPSTRNYDLWYQGKITNTSPSVNGSNETLNVSGMGYQSQLKDIYVSRSYSSTEISVIVKSILDTDIVPNTNITYDLADIESTGFTIDTIDFNSNAQDCLRTLADIAGAREWGVDELRKFFFKARSSTVGFTYPLGGKVLSYSGDDAETETINRVIIIGGGDPPYSVTYNNTVSQLKWGRRDKVYQNSSITTSTVASQIADSIFDEFNDVVRRASFTIKDDVRIEDTLPIPLIRIIPKLTTYNELKYAEFLYSGYINYQVNRCQYAIDDSGNLKINVNLGQLRPDISESISQIEYKLDQIRQQNL